MSKHNLTSANPDALMPHNVEAEEAVLGSLLIDSGTIMYIASFLNEEDFFIERNGWIFAAIRDLSERHEPSDLVTLSDELERRNKLWEIGGPAYLTGLMNVTPTSMHVEFYAHIVERTAIVRRLIEAGGKIARLAYENQGDVDEMVSQAEEWIFGVTRKSRTQYRRIGESSNAVLDDFDYYTAHPEEIRGFKFEMEELDSVIKRVQPGEVVIIGAAQGGGKTALATDVALRAGKNGQGVGFISLEMTHKQLAHRLLANQGGIDSEKFKEPHWDNLDAAERKRLLDAHVVVDKLPIFVDDNPVITLSTLQQIGRRMVLNDEVKVLIIDYLQLLTVTTKNVPRTEQIAEISRGLKIVAKKLNIPIICLSQLTRNSQDRIDKKPRITDLSEGSGIEKNADVVILLYVPDEEEPNVVEAVIGKNRGGGVASRKMLFDKPHLRFLPLTRQTLDY